MKFPVPKPQPPVPIPVNDDMVARRTKQLEIGRLTKDSGRESTILTGRPGDTEKADAGERTTLG